ncbi:MAG: 30S ribosomal protein S9 [Patescibacteria group bacterium]|jgi:small subunit ribosomal protein S9
MSTALYYEGIGRRKASRARVRIWNAEEVKSRKDLKDPLINAKKLSIYFPLASLQQIVLDPITKLGISGIAVEAHVTGGGIRGQAEAIRHGLSRALLKKDASHKTLLRAHGFLTRDARVKERRKFGLKKARRAPQWAKR